MIAAQLGHHYIGKKPQEFLGGLIDSWKN